MTGYMRQALDAVKRERGNTLRLCPHGYHHPMPGNPGYPHSCDGCWCEGERDRREYGWPHNTDPKELS